VTGAAWLSNRDARAGILALLILLAAIATTPADDLRSFVAWAVLLTIAALAAGVRLSATLRRSALVLPFALIFAAAAVPVRGWSFAAALVWRAVLSAFAVFLLTQAISPHRLFAALSRLGCPRALVLVLQLVYRYLFVLRDAALTIRQAALARGFGSRGKRRAYRAAAGMIAVLFASAHARAARVHAAMLSRGYRGDMPSLTVERLRLADGALIIGAIALSLSMRLR
jgi:energy-coupling factor transporter transmembrane protein EcfT